MNYQVYLIEILTSNVEFMQYLSVAHELGLENNNQMQIIAPYGLDDLFNIVLRSLTQKSS